MQIYCEMYNHVAKDDQALVEYVSKVHSLGLYVIALQSKIQNWQTELIFDRLFILTCSRLF
jgi:hypothetical protein